MKALSAEDVADLRRWLISGAVIVLAHGAIAAGMVNWRDEIEPGEPLDQHSGPASRPDRTPGDSTRSLVRASSFNSRA